MRRLAWLATGLVCLPLFVSAPAGAQEAGAAPSASKAARAGRPKREPTAGQMAARERMRKCAGEWREAKAKGATSGQKWPQYWSKCNARLKGNAA